MTTANGLSKRVWARQAAYLQQLTFMSGTSCVSKKGRKGDEPLYVAAQCFGFVGRCLTDWFHGVV